MNLVVEVSPCYRDIGKSSVPVPVVVEQKTEGLNQRVQRTGCSQASFPAFLSCKHGVESGLWLLDAFGEPIICADQKHAEIKTNHRLSEVSVDEAREWIMRTKAFLHYVEESLRETGKPLLRVSYEEVCQQGYRASIRLNEAEIEESRSRHY